MKNLEEQIIFAENICVSEFYEIERDFTFYFSFKHQLKDACNVDWKCSLEVEIFNLFFSIAFGKHVRELL